MNPVYYTTPEELAQARDFLDRWAIGGGVTGVTLPDFRGPFRVPDVPGKAMHGLKLQCGEEVNAGLVLDLVKKYPEWYASQMIQAGVTPRKDE